MVSRMATRRVASYSVAMERKQHGNGKLRSKNFSAQQQQQQQQNSRRPVPRFLQSLPGASSGDPLLDFSSIAAGRVSQSDSDLVSVLRQAAASSTSPTRSPRSPAFTKRGDHKELALPAAGADPAMADSSDSVSCPQLHRLQLQPEHALVQAVSSALALEDEQKAAAAAAAAVAAAAASSRRDREPALLSSPSSVALTIHPSVSASLPGQVDSASSSSAAAAAAASSTAASAASPDDFAVLAVDDAVMNRKILVRHMTALGVKCDMAENGAQAVMAVRSNPGKYACIFMDLAMPILNGELSSEFSLRDLRAQLLIVSKATARRRSSAPWASLTPSSRSQVRLISPHP